MHYGLADGSDLVLIKREIEFDSLLDYFFNKLIYMSDFKFHSIHLVLRMASGLALIKRVIEFDSLLDYN